MHVYVCAHISIRIAYSYVPVGVVVVVPVLALEAGTNPRNLTHENVHDSLSANILLLKNTLYKNTDTTSGPPARPHHNQHLYFLNAGIKVALTCSSSFKRTSITSFTRTTITINFADDKKEPQLYTH